MVAPNAMKKLGYFLLSVALILGPSGTKATTVIAPTFDELVAQAETIFEGVVTDVTSQWVGEGAQRHIVSYITFNVQDTLKGNPNQKYTIRMLGGTVDGESMGVSDAPKFKVGDKDILFVEHNGTQFIPLVGIMHGRFHVKRDQRGEEIVMNNENEPVKNVARLGRDQDNPGGASERNLTAADFKAAVKSKLQKPQ
jgi:hypothetical protein